MSVKGFGSNRMRLSYSVELYVRFMNCLMFESFYLQKNYNWAVIVTRSYGDGRATHRNMREVGRTFRVAEQGCDKGCGHYLVHGQTRFGIGIGVGPNQCITSSTEIFLNNAVIEPSTGIYRIFLWVVALRGTWRSCGHQYLMRRLLRLGLPSSASSCQYQKQRTRSRP